MTGSKPLVANVLANRYASPEMAEIWSAENKVVLERELWVAVLVAQKDLGIKIDDAVVDAYRSVMTDVDLESIDRRERVTLHDVKARIEEFSSLAGYEHIHKGLTSRDLTENVEQLQIKLSLVLTQQRVVAVISRLAGLAIRYQETAITGRSHNVPAQMTTLGKRLANLGQETLLAYERLEDLLNKYPLRGLKGPVGTQQDLLDLFEGDAGKVAELEERVAKQLGFEQTLQAVGQIYPRSLDLDVVSALTQTASPLGNIALQIRLMAGLDLATEGFNEGQVGSSARPHKMTAASDGALETILTVLDGFGSYSNVIDRELERYLPFLATTRLLMASVKAGAGREEAHEIIKQHAIEAALEIREGSSGENDLIERLVNDPLLPLDRDAATEALSDRGAFIGMADSQVSDFVASAATINSEHPGAESYRPSPIL